jgi:holo-[acyl-carrier protein] synthase
MPLEVGIDFVSREEVEEAIRRHGRRYLERVYTPRERADSESNPLRLAARFAAKEATMKALGRGDGPLDWRTIELRQDADGRPTLHLTGAAGELARRAGVEGLSVSLSHRRQLAAAVVLAKVGAQR